MLAVQEDGKRWEDEREQERLRRDQGFAEQLAEAWRRVELGHKLEEMKLGNNQERVLNSLLTLPQEALGLLREHLVLPERA
jgi:hypothetical protein